MLMTYSGFFESSFPRIPLKRSMFEVSAYLIACLSVADGAGGGGTDRTTETECEEVREGGRVEKARTCCK